MSLQDRIFNKDWAAIHPFQTSCQSDPFFVDVANNLYKSIKKVKSLPHVEKGALRLCAINATAYLEDIISTPSLWKAFTTKYEAEYGKKLPFYDIDDDYIENEVNLQDLQFIVWFTLQRNVKEGTVIDPADPYILHIATTFYKHLFEYYETAPENEELNEYLKKMTDCKDMGTFQDFAYWIYTYSYLFSESVAKRDAQINALLKPHVSFLSMDEIQRLAYGYQKELVQTSPSGPLALYVNEWAALLAAQLDVKNAKRFETIQTRKKEIYLIVSDTKTHLTLSSAEEEKIKIAKSDLPPNMEFQKGDSVETSLTLFDNRWFITNSLIISDSETFKKEAEARKEKKEGYADAFEKFKSVAGRKTLLCYPDFEAFFGDFPDFIKYRENLNASFGTTNVLVFASEEEGIMLSPGLASYIKDPKNESYDKELTEKNGIKMLMCSYMCPDTLLRLILGGKKTSDMAFQSSTGARGGKKTAQSHLEFIARAIRGYRL
ncbi:MAG: DUF3843 family protein [Bacteroidales bacterium]